MKTEIPEEIQKRLTEAEVYLDQGLIDEARLVYEELLQNLPEESNGLREEIQKKIAELGQATDDDKEPPVLLEIDENEKAFLNAVALKDSGFLPEAINEFRRLIDKGYREFDCWRHLGEAYISHGMIYEGIEALKKALEAPGVGTEEYLDTCYRIGLALETAGAYTKAIQYYEKVKEINPSYLNVSDRIEELSRQVERFGRFYYLIQKKIITEEDFEEATKLAKEKGTSIEKTLIEDFGVPKEEVGKALAEFYKRPFIEFDELEVGEKPACLEGVREQFLRANVCVPIMEKPGGTVVVAIDNPNDIVKIDAIRRVLKAKNLEFVVSLREDINQFIDYFYGKYGLSEDDEDVFSQLEVIPEEEEEEGEETPEAENVVVQLANRILEDAYNKGASDIHIESLSGKRGARIRFRIDGDCIHYQDVPYAYKKALVSRFKIMADLDIAEKRLPQDGKIKFRTRSGRVFEVRVATLPTIDNNEDVVMRILAAVEAMPLDKIGLREENLKRFQEALELPYGLILVVGPTGSGKTTTLHAALGYVNRAEKKIWTAEDPVEIVQEGLRQVQVRPKIGLTFARALRAFLRADPDIIMIGETRDEETAHTVIEASLTGHLVFTTLHTNSAPETIVRLLGMGMDPFNFADALLAILAQRLAKRLCSCKEPYEPSPKEIEEILYEYGDHPVRPLTAEDLKGITIYRPKGCTRCHKTGYRGRLAIHELLVASDSIRELIQKRAPVAQIRGQAMAEGMLTLKQDGILKVLEGHTDVKQIRAVCLR